MVPICPVCAVPGGRGHVCRDLVSELRGWTPGEPGPTNEARGYLHIEKLPISQEMREEIDMANYLRDHALSLLTPAGRELVEEAERRSLHELMFGKGNA